MGIRRWWIALVGLTISACAGSVQSLDEGQCFDEPSTAQVTDVDVVACGEPHDLEVYRVLELDDQPFDQSVIDERSLERCIAAFEPFVGVEYQESTLDIYYLVPSPEGWRSGDREVVCAVYDYSGRQLTGSVAGTGR